MKNLLLLFATVFILTCCDKDDDKTNPIDQLPPATQTGANTAGCLVNGEAFLPYNKGLYTGVNCFYQFVDGDFYFNITIADFRKSTPKGVSVQTRKINLEAGQTYNLTKNVIDDYDFNGGGGNYDIGASNRYFTNTVRTGELRITRVDLQKSIVSGTFWFDAVNASGENVEVREGRFDWNY